MKENIIIVNTYFQLMTAINLSLNNLKNDINDLLITDRSVGMEEKAKELKKLNIFRNIFYIESKTICTNSNKLSKYYTYLFDRKKILKDQIKYSYDYIYFYNFDLVTYALFDEINKKNKKVKCNKFEEGFISYLYESKNNLLNQIIRKLLFRKNINKSIEKHYLYHPELLFYETDLKIEKISKIDKDNKQLKMVYNKLFNYNDEVLDCKYIFFEECFFCDKKDMDDMDLILNIAEIVGKENLIVKLHPRNKIDRFAEYGIKTNKTIGIPWEVIQMNNDFSDKVLLTITSGSVLASTLYFDESIKTYLLFNCTEKKSDMLTEKYLEYLEKIKTESFIIPENKTEFFESLEKEKNDINIRKNKKNT